MPFALRVDMVSNKKSILAKIWHFIWKDDSILSWIVNIILAFLIVKFLVYPGLGVLFGTTHPVVAVVSCSMEHNKAGSSCSTKHLIFDEWWDVYGMWYDERGYNMESFKKWTFSNGFNKGDIMVLIGAKIEKIKVGDIVVFRGNSREPIIHRVVLKYNQNGKIYIQTKGDNNPDTLVGLGEDMVSQDKLIGKAVFRVPLLGWIKIVAVDFVNLVKGV